jgi:hypothetical protein
VSLAGVTCSHASSFRYVCGAGEAVALCARCEAGLVNVTPAAVLPRCASWFTSQAIGGPLVVPEPRQDDASGGRGDADDQEGHLARDADLR